VLCLKRKTYPPIRDTTVSAVTVRKGVYVLLFVFVTVLRAISVSGVSLKRSFKNTLPTPVRTLRQSKGCAVLTSKFVFYVFNARRSDARVLNIPLKVRFRPSSVPSIYVLTERVRVYYINCIFILIFVFSGISPAPISTR